MTDTSRGSEGAQGSDRQRYNLRGDLCLPFHFFSLLLGLNILAITIIFIHTVFICVYVSLFFFTSLIFLL